MTVLQYNANGFPLYWIGDDHTGRAQLWKRIDKNTDEIVRNVPARFRKAVEAAKKGA